MPGYTFFLKGFGGLGRETSLSLSHAFDRVIAASGYVHAFVEDSDGKVILSLERDGGEDIEIRATAEIETDGEREVMALAMDGQLDGFMAVPDDQFEKYLHASAAPVGRHAIRFLVLAALKSHIHMIPKVREMQTGHAKRMLDAGVESLANAVSGSLVETGVRWSKL